MSPERPQSLIKHLPPEERGNAELAKQFFHRENFSLNGKDVEILGVYHRPENIIVHHEEIEAAVGNAGTIVIEITPDISGLQEALKMLNWDEETKNEIRSTFHFYSYIENLAGFQGKTVVHIDPSETGKGEEYFKNIQAFNQQDDEIQRIKELISAGVPAAVVINIVRRKLRKKNESADKSTEKQGPKGMTRRLFNLAALGTAAGIIASRVATQIDRQSDTLVGRKDNPLGVLLYELEDYRNAVVAEGLDRLTKKNISGPVEVIYGDAHRSAIRRYAMSPEERRARIKLYEPFRKIKKPKLRMYKPIVDRSKGKIDWEQILDEKL